MKTILFLILLIPTLSFGLSCEKAEKMGEYLSMNGDQFMQAYKNHKLAGHKDELRLPLDDVNQARKVAYKLPALQDLGFPPVDKSWSSFVVKMEKSSLKGMKSGKTFKNANGDVATIRLDFDPIKGGHYNIDVMKKTSKGKESFKLSIEFLCNGKMCTGDEVKKLAQSLQ